MFSSPQKLLNLLISLTAGLSNAIIYSSPDDKRKNRGFCFLEYESHKAASVAKKKLGSRPIRVWNCDIIVDWADPQEEPDSETMSKVCKFRFQLVFQAAIVKNFYFCSAG